MGDSFYEYLLKTWLLTGKKHEQYKRMYLEAVKGMQRRLIIEEGGLTYLCEEKSGKLVRKMDHLVCFVPGTLALGAQPPCPSSATRRARDEPETSPR